MFISLAISVESGLVQWLKTWCGKGSSGGVLLHDFFIIFTTSDGVIASKQLIIEFEFDLNELFTLVNL